MPSPKRSLTPKPKSVVEKTRRLCPLCSGKSYRIVYPSTLNAKDYLTTHVFSARRLPDRIHGTIVACRSCGLYRNLEIIEPKTLKVLYQNSSFTYQNLTDNLIASYGRILSDASQYTDKESFLEIGCGNGFLLIEARRMGFKKIAGTEPSLDAVNQASSKIKSLIKPDILRPNLFKKNSFDLIAAFQVFDHIPDPNQFLHICRSLLKSRGVLLLMNHDVTALPARLLGEKSPIFDIEHPYLYNQKTIQKILEKNHFNIIKLYSPPAVFSLGYLLRLLPLPNLLKKAVMLSKNKVFEFKVKIYPGNLVVYAQK